MADPRRRMTLQGASASQSQSLIPSSIPRPRHSLAPPPLQSSSLRPSISSSSSLSLGVNNNGGRQQLSSLTNNNNHNPLFESQSSSQGTQLFSQGHGGPTTSTNPTRERDPPSTAARGSSMYHSTSSLGGPQFSVNRPGTTLKGSASVNNLDYPASERRTSSYRRSTLLPPGATPLSHSTLTQPRNAALKDPRDNKPLEVRKRYASSIVSFLSARNFIGPANSGPATEKQLLQPTGAQFAAFFKFLVGCLDSSYNGNGRWGQQGKKWEDEVAAVLVAVGYPFAGSITKSHLQSVGSQQSWPNMLAMLHWFVEAVERRDSAYESATYIQLPDPEHLLSQPSNEVPLADLTFASWIDFASESYQIFLSAPDDEDFDITNELEERFLGRLDQGRTELRKRVYDLEVEGDELDKEWNELTKDPDPIVQAQTDLELSTKDRQTFIGHVNKVEKKLSEKRNDKVRMLSEKELKIKERNSSQSTIQRLTHQIATQGMTPSEIQHLSSEKSQLQSLQQTLYKKQQSKLEASMSLEIELAKKLSKVSTLISLYSSKAEGLGLLPVERGDSTRGEYKGEIFEQELNGAKDDPTPGGVGELRPALVDLRGRTRAEVGTMGRRIVEDEEEVTKKKEVVDELEEEVKKEEEELEVVNKDNAETVKEANGELARGNDEIERLRNHLNQMMSNLGQNLAIAEARYTRRVQERTQADEDTARVRRENRTALEAALDEIISYKSHVLDQTNVVFNLAEKAEERGQTFV